MSGNAELRSEEFLDPTPLSIVEKEDAEGGRCAAEYEVVPAWLVSYLSATAVPDGL